DPYFIGDGRSRLQQMLGIAGQDVIGQLGLVLRQLAGIVRDPVEQLHNGEGSLWGSDPVRGLTPSVWKGVRPRVVLTPSVWKGVRPRMGSDPTREILRQVAVPNPCFAIFIAK